MSVSDKDKLEYWSNASVGDLIRLSDEQTIGFLMDQGCKHISHGADFMIRRKREISEMRSKVRRIIFDIEYSDFIWYFVLEGYGENFESFVYYMPDSFVDGNRDAILENCDWLMDPWEEGIELKDLLFAKEIQQGDGVVFYSRDVKYGICSEDDEDRSFTTIVEYKTDSEEENPLLMALEFNQIEEWSDQEENEEEDYVEVIEESGITINEESSYIMLLQGCSVPLSDVELLEVK